MTTLAPEAGPASVLIADDDDDIRSIVARHLTLRGHAVVAVADGAAALDMCRRRRPDVAVLDIDMPGCTGLDVLREVRREGLPLAVIMLSSAAAELDRVIGLELGADDYLTKPFSLRELEARVRAVRRRPAFAELSSAPGPEVIEVLDITIEPEAREVRRGGAVVALTAKEFDLLAHLASQPRRVFTRDELLEDVWGSSADWQQAATVTEHIRRLRAKLERDPAHPAIIRTVRGAGYRLDLAVP